MEFRAHLSAVAGEVEAVLDELLTSPAGLAPGEPELWQAMRHATLGGGKRMRAFFAVEGAAILGVHRASTLRAAASVECLHAYSLVHDDLPAMDDDDMRRGKPTVHIAFGEATAILAGDALQSMAFGILADPATHADPAVRAALCLALAEAVGASGMVGGQAIDMAAESATAPFDLPTITRLQAGKTGALFRFAAESGAILAADANARRSFADFAQHFGLAFQIRDDVLDIEGDESLTGKRLGKDTGAGKATFVSLMGLDGARAAAANEAARAKAALAPFGQRARWLMAAADFAVARTS